LGAGSCVGWAQVNTGLNDFATTAAGVRLAGQVPAAVWGAKGQAITSVYCCARTAQLSDCTTTPAQLVLGKQQLSVVAELVECCCEYGSSVISQVLGLLLDLAEMLIYAAVR